MPQSMTGFGAAEGAVCGGRLRLEVRTVNHRFLAPQLKLPDELLPLEGKLRELIRSHFDRGHVSVAARWSEAPVTAQSVRVNLARARALVAALRELKTSLGLAGEPDVALVSRHPDVLATSEGDPTAVPWSEVEPVARAALEEAQRLRGHEGAALAGELLDCLSRLDVLVGAIEQRVPERLVRERDRVRAQVASLSASVDVDSARLAQEIALLAERMDIREEIVRLRTHVAAAREALAREGPVGKELGFLGQEMLREINTIGAKANDAEIARSVITMKGELERFREQLENLE